MDESVSRRHGQPVMSPSRPATLRTTVSMNNLNPSIVADTRLPDAQIDNKPQSLEYKWPDSLSLFSASSKTGGSRHALLKSTISASQPIDLGLPVPPVLTPTFGAPEKGISGKNEVLRGLGKFGARPITRSQSCSDSDHGDNLASNQLDIERLERSPMLKVGAGDSVRIVPNSPPLLPLAMVPEFDEFRMTPLDHFTKDSSEEVEVSTTVSLDEAAEFRMEEANDPDSKLGHVHRSSSYRNRDLGIFSDPSCAMEKEPLNEDSTFLTSWLTSLISKQTDYEPVFTSMPSPSVREKRQSNAEISHNALTEVIRNNFRVDSRPFDTKMEALKLELEKQSDSLVTMSFANTINNLEHLLNEALHIVQEVAETDIPAHGDTTEPLSIKLLEINDCSIASSRSISSAQEYCDSALESDSREKENHSSTFSCSANSSINYRQVLNDDSPNSRFKLFPVRIFENPDSQQGSFESVDLDDEITISREELAQKPSIREGEAMAMESSSLLATEEGNGRCTDHIWDHASTTLSRPKTEPTLNRRDVRNYIKVFQKPPVHERLSSLGLKRPTHNTKSPSEITQACLPRWHLVSSACSLPHSYQSLDGSASLENSTEMTTFSSPFDPNSKISRTAARDSSKRPVELRDDPDPKIPRRQINGKPQQRANLNAKISLTGKSHVSLKGKEHKELDLSRTHRREPIARDWSPHRKRMVAAVSCITTALIGMLIGIYAGEVPSIQYYIVDLHHYTILGNVFLYIGLAISTVLFWPLPLMHGRKPYILSAMTLAMPLIFPQAIAVSAIRSPNGPQWRTCLLLPRALMGFCLGLANINLQAILTDLFGASLQSSNPHQEIVDEFDVRRHGGGLGVWLGIWTWCSIGSIGFGFMIGAIIIQYLEPAWGFYISIIIIAGVLLLNVLTPEVRRSANRKCIIQVGDATHISRRLGRGEIMLHRVQTGPVWWWQELYHGLLLSASMLRQAGFLVVALYVAWIYAQIVLIIVLLGSLTSKSYQFKSPYVGVSVAAVPIGGILAIPFQKASLFSRARHHAQRTNSMTFEKRVTPTSHLVRRTIFTLVLPFAGLAYTLSSGGPPTPFILPILFAGLIGFLSSLAIAECHGIIMEVFDTSDLQPGMTGRPRGVSGERSAHKRTSYSAFPRVSSAFAIIQAIGYLIAAAATGVGGVAQRNLGQQTATGVMAAVLLVLTILLLGVLIRFKDIQIVPTSKADDMKRWRASIASGAEEPWRPVVIGNPTGTTRRVNVLELGGLSRYSEIRLKNRLVDEATLEAKHPNLAALGSIKHKIRAKRFEVAGHVRDSLSRGSSQQSEQSDSYDEMSQTMAKHDMDGLDLGGNREIQMTTGKRSGVAGHKARKTRAR